MSQLLDAATFPLHGSRLIEASAGTGKTWTIAALYLRLVLGHGGEAAFGRPLLPAEILVMTFTRAATRELSTRVRERLVEAAAWFRGELELDDPYLEALAAGCIDIGERQRAAHRLVLAAETMDEAAIFTIDAWCQRMLREHAFDSGSLFDEELVSDESALFEDAAHDYWRQNVYPLNAAALGMLLACWSDVGALKKLAFEELFDFEITTVSGRPERLVEDNGIGIEPVHHERVFQIFGHVHPEKKYGGTGIGLGGCPESRAAQVRRLLACGTTMVSRGRDAPLRSRDPPDPPENRASYLMARALRMWK